MKGRHRIGEEVVVSHFEQSALSGRVLYIFKECENISLDQRKLVLPEVEANVQQGVKLA